MRLKHSYVVALLGLSICIAAQETTDGSHPHPQSNEPIETYVADEAIDVCLPLYDAQTLLKELEPAPFAHLEKKASGSVGPFGAKWGEGLGWGHEGPISTALRLLPRVLNSLLSPLTLLQHLPVQLPSFLSPQQTPKSKRVRLSKSRRIRIETLIELLEEAEQAGCHEVYLEKARIRMFPPKGIKQDLAGAYEAYKKYLTYKADPEAQFMVGVFHATGLGGISEDQGKAALYYTFAALQGYKPAEMALGYRHWAGISVKEDCMTALDFYEGAAEKAYTDFLAGPPGGRSLPLTSSRLSDQVGGIYGPHASWASTGANSLRPAVRAAMASARGETEMEVLEYYQYHSDRDSHAYTVRLGRLFYLGSVYPLPGGVSSGAERVGEIPQSYGRAREYFTKVARNFWPKDYDNTGAVAPKRKMTAEVEDSIRDPAMIAASFLGRMAFRGEGQKKDLTRALLWYERAAELGDREAHNALGIMYRDGLAVRTDKKRAFAFFEAAAQPVGQPPTGPIYLAEAEVNLGKLHLERGEIHQAMQYFEVALRHGSPFEAFHLLSHIHATQARLPALQGGQRGTCGVSVAYYKLVAERGCWDESDFIGRGDRAWLRGETEAAILNWLIAGEMGYEGGQNNVAFMLDQGHGADLFAKDSLAPSSDEAKESRWLQGQAMRWWVRSAAQDNVDAMVKVGDLYYSGLVPSNIPSTRDATPLELAANYYQTAADTHTSSMAYWNLGWMYETGKGVTQDWFLAKRFYDLSGETGREAWIAVWLSVIGLYIRSWLTEIRTGGATPGLRLFEPPAEDDTPLEQPSMWSRLSSLFVPPIGDYEPLNMNDEDAYDDFSGSQWGGGGVNGDLADWEEDVLETLVIGGLITGVVLLVWLRGWWVRQEENRVRREQARAAAAGGPIPPVGQPAGMVPPIGNDNNNNQNWPWAPPPMP